MGTSGACRQYAARPGYVADGSFSTIERHDIESCAVACQSSAKCLGFEYVFPDNLHTKLLYFADGVIFE